MAEETYNLPPGESNVNTNAQKWQRVGYYMHVQDDIKVGRFAKPDINQKSDNFDKVETAYVNDVEEADASFQKLFQKEIKFKISLFDLMN